MANTLDEARHIIDQADAQMAELFVQRMRAVRMVYEHKKECGLPIFDPGREDAVIEKNAALVEDEVLKGYYIDYLKHVMAVSRAYQHRMQSDVTMAYSGAEEAFAHMAADRIVVDGNKNLDEHRYDILVERGILAHANQHLHLDRRVLIVTDSGVPEDYAKTVANQSREGIICTIQEGESSKSLDTFGTLLQTMLDHGFSRNDCVVAVGGGVVGDLAGFAASAYMRGIDFYNIPTTLLSQIDSSIGGKTAINFGGVKNVVGAFYQPKKVLIDPELLKTLPPRQVANGLAEAIKMALTCDKELFDTLENKDIETSMDEIILRCLHIKKSVVEQDEKESGLRKVLNFGHTIGHGIESSRGMTDLYHGECVALGMLPMCADAIRPRVIEVLKKCRLYRTLSYDWEKITEAAFHDKKADGNAVTIITVNEIGNFEMKTMHCLDVIEMAKNSLEGLEA